MAFKIFKPTGFVGSNLKERLGDKGTPDVVFHLACDGDSRGSNLNMVCHTQSNLDLFVETLDRAIKEGLKRFIYVSSSEVVWNKSVYSIEKLACEEILKLQASIHGFEYVIVRPHNLFGEHMNLNDKNRNVVANFIRERLAGNDVSLIGDPHVTRQFTYIGQLIDVLEESITKNTNQTITVTSGVETSIEDLDYMITNLIKTIKWASSVTIA